jgi:hypothetical protein
MQVLPATISLMLVRGSEAIALFSGLTQIWGRGEINYGLFPVHAEELYEIAYDNLLTSFNLSVTMSVKRGVAVVVLFADDVNV